MGRHRDKIEQDLFAELARLRQRLQEVHEQGGCQDPDSVMAELESKAELVDQMTEELLLEIEAASPKRSDLNGLANEASGQLLASVSFPVVVHTCLDPQLPEVLLSPDLLRPVVQRALLIAAEQQGPGCKLTVKTSKEGRTALLGITASNIGSSVPSSCLPIHARSASLVQLVEEAGGEVELEEGEGRVRLSIRLAHGVPTR